MFITAFQDLHPGFSMMYSITGFRASMIQPTDAGSDLQGLCPGYPGPRLIHSLYAQPWLQLRGLHPSLLCEGPMALVPSWQTSHHLHGCQAALCLSHVGHSLLSPPQENIPAP